MEALLNISGLAKKLSISRSSIYRLITEENFPKPFYVGKSIRFDPADIDDYIQRQKDKAQSSGGSR